MFVGIDSVLLLVNSVVLLVIDFDSFIVVV